ncbi:MAG TPA: hypothetical protein PKD99_06980 [Sphingopyxis sp.]|nr:hypothetical protein [Sphingopyxis sp.]HMP44834.1 hypothetical protein [Sphingopyxis sp.]HMQ17593.1 hypothetical protein [Sphingopyxis sp.]
MFKLSPLAAAWPLAGAACLALVPAAAQASGGAYYRAELAAPAPKGKFVSRGVVWSCAGNSCVAGRGTSRPLIMCAGLAKDAGAVTAFIADGKALEADELARCNGAK